MTKINILIPPYTLFKEHILKTYPSKYFNHSTHTRVKVQEGLTDDDIINDFKNIVKSFICEYEKYYTEFENFSFRIVYPKTESDISNKQYSSQFKTIEIIYNNFLYKAFTLTETTCEVKLADFKETCVMIIALEKLFYNNEYSPIKLSEVNNILTNNDYVIPLYYVFNDTEKFDKYCSPVHGFINFKDFLNIKINDYLYLKTYNDKSLVKSVVSTYNNAISCGNYIADYCLKNNMLPYRNSIFEYFKKYGSNLTNMLPDKFCPADIILVSKKFTTEQIINQFEFNNYKELNSYINKFDKIVPISLKEYDARSGKCKSIVNNFRKIDITPYSNFEYEDIGHIVKTYSLDKILKILTEIRYKIIKFIDDNDLHDKVIYNLIEMDDNWKVNNILNIYNNNETEAKLNLGIKIKSLEYALFIISMFVYDEEYLLGQMINYAKGNSIKSPNFYKIIGDKHGNNPTIIKEISETSKNKIIELDYKNKIILKDSDLYKGGIYLIIPVIENKESKTIKIDIRLNRSNTYEPTIELL